MRISNKQDNQQTYHTTRFLSTGTAIWDALNTDLSDMCDTATYIMRIPAFSFRMLPYTHNTFQGCPKLNDTICQWNKQTANKMKVFCGRCFINYLSSKYNPPQWDMRMISVSIVVVPESNAQPLTNGASFNEQTLDRRLLEML